MPRGRFLEVADDRKLFVRMTDGDASVPPTLLLHGLGATAALNWASCFGPLAREARVLAPDLRGHGRGPRVGNHFRLVDCADDAAAILRAAGGPPAVVVGYSMGGPIAQQPCSCASAEHCSFGPT